MFTTPLVIATLTAATLGAVIGFLLGGLGVRSTITRLRTELADAVWRLTHDPLTGLHNRIGLLAIYTATAASGESQPIVAVLIDLDLFKDINDAHGHDAGDDLLRTTADRIGQLAGLYGGHATRLSGDEFAAIIPLNGNRVSSMAEHFTTVIAEPIEVRTDNEPITVTITASLGIAVTSSTELLEGVALHHADLAMYHAKQRGGDQHVTYAPGMVMPDCSPRKGPRPRDLRRRAGGGGE